MKGFEILNVKTVIRLKEQQKGWNVWRRWMIYHMINTKKNGKSHKNNS